jgi:hypothetical protein
MFFKVIYSVWKNVYHFHDKVQQKFIRLKMGHSSLYEFGIYCNLLSS